MIKFDDAFIARYARPAGARKSPILFFHSHSPDGAIHWQGYIYRLDKDGTGEAQLFEWFMGAPSDTVRFTKAFLAECSFYSSDRAMFEAYARYDQARRP